MVKNHFFDYFTSSSSIYSNRKWIIFNGSLIDILAGPLAPGQYAQATEGALSIGDLKFI